MTNATTARRAIYMVNVPGDVSAYHSVILEAIANGGTFDEDFADIFTLTKTPEGSAVDYVLNFA